jgi:hypothetical protein
LSGFVKEVVYLVIKKTQTMHDLVQHKSPRVHDGSFVEIIDRRPFIQRTPHYHLQHYVLRHIVAMPLPYPQEKRSQRPYGRIWCEPAGQRDMERCVEQSSCSIKVHTRLKASNQTHITANDRPAASTWTRFTAARRPLTRYQVGPAG